MFREIKIGDKTVPMLANGATPIRYRMVFGKDLIQEMQAAGGEGSRGIDAISELAYIMAMAADGNQDMNRLNQEMYITWMEGFGPMDVTNSADDIINLYVGNTRTNSKSKKNKDEQSET